MDGFKEFLSSEVNIRETLKPLGYWGKEYNFYVFTESSNLGIMASFLMLLGPLGLLLSGAKNYILNISDNGITTIKLSVAGNVLKDQITFLPWGNVTGIDFSEGRYYSKIFLDVDDGTQYIYKIWDNTDNTANLPHFYKQIKEFILAAKEQNAE